MTDFTKEILSGPSYNMLEDGAMPKRLVVLLHGYGANADDLLALATQWAPFMQDAEFIALNAPHPYEMFDESYPHMAGVSAEEMPNRQWFSLQNGRTKLERLAGARAVEDQLRNSLEYLLKEYQLTYKDLVLVGFSQGGMMAMHVGLQFPEACAGIIGYSTLWLTDENIHSKSPICLVHGTDDDIIPFDAMRYSSEGLTALGLDVETHRCDNLPHSINQKGIEVGLRFMEHVFNA